MKFINKTIGPVLVLLAVIWIVEMANHFMGHRLGSWGILPRHLSGLIGIPLMPFLHTSVEHTLSNTFPILVLGGMFLVSGRSHFWATTIAIILLSGLLVWLFARTAYHTGASGLVFGYFGALLTRAIIERSVLSIVIGAVTIAMYGGIVWGVFPQEAHVSFEAHFFGLLAGIICTWLYFKFSTPVTDQSKTTNKG